MDSEVRNHPDSETAINVAASEASALHQPVDNTLLGKNVDHSSANRKRVDSTTGGEGSDDDDDDDEDTGSFGGSEEGVTRTESYPTLVGGTSTHDKYTTIRREKRLAMNRESARNRRKRKKMLIQTLEDQVSNLRKLNQQHQLTIDSLSLRARTLENELTVARITISQLFNASGIGAALTHRQDATNTVLQPQNQQQIQSTIPMQQLQLQQFQLSNQQQQQQHHLLLDPSFSSHYNVSAVNIPSIATTPLSINESYINNSVTYPINPFDQLRSIAAQPGARGLDTSQHINRLASTASATASEFASINNAIGGHENLTRMIQANTESSSMSHGVIGEFANMPPWSTICGGAVPNEATMDESLFGERNTGELLPEIQQGMYQNLMRNNDLNAFDSQDARGNYINVGSLGNNTVSFFRRYNRLCHLISVMAPQLSLLFSLIISSYFVVDNSSLVFSIHR
jgi:hypothetical protein